jgi:hypothetical protein
MTLPWISKSEIDKTIIERNKTLDQRKTEVSKAKKDWSNI